MRITSSNRYAKVAADDLEQLGLQSLDTGCRIDRARRSRPVHIAVLCSAIVATLIYLWLGPLYNLVPTYSPAFPSREDDVEHNLSDAAHSLALQLHAAAHIHREPKLIEHDWTVSQGLRSPDGVEKLVYLINGQFPGPTIEARSGDSIKVNVHNALRNDEGVAFHWHGLHLKDHNDMDGAVGFTQEPVAPGSSFSYEFEVGPEEHGTFWYHGHAQVQRGDGLYGGFIVHEPAEFSLMKEPTEEVLLMIGDWYHRDAEEALKWYQSVRAFGNEPSPDSLLINGFGHFDCSMAVAARPVNCSQMPSDLRLKPVFASGEKTRVRLINVGSLAGFSISSSWASMLPIAVESFAVTGEASSGFGILYPGERVDFILQPRAESENEPIFTIALDAENLGYPNPSLRPVQQFYGLPGSAEVDAPQSLPQLENVFDMTSASPDDTISPRSNPPVAADETIILYTKIAILAKNGNHPVAYINTTTFKPQSPPLISIPRADYDSNQLVPLIPLNSVVDIVVNNLDDNAHPFHLHGHDFWLLKRHRSERGWGSLVPEPNATYDFSKALRKDTVMVPRRGHVVLRVLMDNPGLWMFHCHMLVHQASGMVMGFEVSDKITSGSIR